MSLMEQAKKENPNILSLQDVQILLGNVSLSRVYYYLKKANVTTRKLADNTPYLLEEDYKKLIFRGEVPNDENNQI
jgi:hypothetical protein